MLNEFVIHNLNLIFFAHYNLKLFLKCSNFIDIFSLYIETVLLLIA